MEDRHVQDSFHASLGDRGVIGIAGPDAKGFLQGLVTNEVQNLAPGGAVYAALLSPQGKILGDFLVTEAAAEKGGGLYLDCPRALAADLVKRLTLYRLRAKIMITDVSDRLRVDAAWGEAALPSRPDHAVAAFRDPRDSRLGWRFIVERDSAPTESESSTAGYEAHRVALGIPKGGADFAYGEAFPHDANLDLIHGVDFNKGCFVGQEVVSRVEHRGTARKRIVRVHFAGPAPAPRSEIVAGGISIGTFGSAAAGTGLAMIRTDRAEEAISAHLPLVAGGVELALAPAG